MAKERQVLSHTPWRLCENFSVAKAHSKVGVGLEKMLDSSTESASGWAERHQTGELFPLETIPAL